MLWWIVSALLALWVLTYPVADVIFHHAQWGAFHANEDQRQVALTFDDGPAEDTVAILTELHRLNIKATFFMVAERASEHPEWVTLVVSGGHEIGLHGYRHRSAYLNTPWGTMADIAQGVAKLRDLSGQPIQWYRPPWGHHNLWTWWACRRLRLKRVLWTVAPDDWRAAHSKEKISNHVVKAALPGGVVVLHDGGGDRTRTRLALPLIAAGLRRIGIEPVPMEALAFEASWLKTGWRWWETRFQVAWDLDPVPSQGSMVPIFRLGKIRFRGSRLALSSVVLDHGDWFGELHFDNSELSRFSDDTRHVLKAYQAIRQSLVDLASFVGQSEKYQDVLAFGGVTVLNAGKAIERLGFVRVPVVGWRRLSMRLYLIWLMAMYHRQGWRSIKRYRHLSPVLLVIDRQTLIQRYPSDGTSPTRVPS